MPFILIYTRFFTQLNKVASMFYSNSALKLWQHCKNVYKNRQQIALMPTSAGRWRRTAWPSSFAGCKTLTESDAPCPAPIQTTLPTLSISTRTRTSFTPETSILTIFCFITTTYEYYSQKNKIFNVYINFIITNNTPVQTEPVAY